jgi:Zn-dependent membrane protease YugP
MFFGIDVTYLVLVLPAVLLAMWAQANVKSTFAKYSKVASKRGMTGFDAARRILDVSGLSHVRIGTVQGDLTDHFNPADNTVYLSDTVHSVRSVAAIGVAAHEAGHAVQHAVGYSPMKLRAAIIPITNIGSKLAMPLILIGVLLSAFYEMSYTLVYLGIACFGLSLVFQLITLPVEFNASRRAMIAISDASILTEEEQRGARKTLTAAALTYVAATAVALMQLLRLILIFGGRRRND